MTRGKPSDSDIERVKCALAGGYWIKGRDISMRYGIPYRNIRAVAEKTGDVISGQNGYRLASHATTAEIHRAIADLRSRSNRIAERAIKIERHLTGDGFSGELFV